MKHLCVTTVSLFLLLFMSVWCRAKFVTGDVSSEITTVSFKNTFSVVEKKATINHPNSLTILFPVEGKELLLDLILNKELIPKTFFRKVQENGRHKIEAATEQMKLCHYRGHVRNGPDSWVALSTCDGLSGVVYDGKQMHHIEKKKFGKDNVHFLRSEESNESDRKIFRMKRDTAKKNKPIRGPYKANSESRFLELLLVVDNAKYKEFNRSSERVELYCKDIANVVHGIFSSLDIFVALVGVVIWTEQDEISLSTNGDTTLTNFLRYRRDKLLRDHPNDNAQLLTKASFEGGVLRKALLRTICTSAYSGGVFVDYSPAYGITASTVAHLIGHNLGMEHDSENCSCPEAKCIMATHPASLVPTQWSSCSLNDLKSSFNQGMDHCLKNKPTSIFRGPVCGNGFVEDGEQCDCGLSSRCDNDCCNATTCMLNSNAQCATGQCCDLTTCKLRQPGILCRWANTECDLPEYCTGQTEYCPADVYRMDTEACKNGKGYCYQGHCHTRSEQCRLLWGRLSESSDDLCYRLNVKGTRHGNCGYDELNQSYAKCEEEDVFCGLLHCNHSSERLLYGHESVSLLSHSFVNSKGSIIPCKTAIVDLGLDQSDPGMVPDGTKCGEGKMCLNQKCTSVTTLQGNLTCPNNCYGNGWCNSLGHCHCKAGYGKPHCQYLYPGGSVDSGPVYSYLNVIT